MRWRGQVDCCCQGKGKQVEWGPRPPRPGAIPTTDWVVARPQEKRGNTGEEARKGKLKVGRRELVVMRSLGIVAVEIDDH